MKKYRIVYENEKFKIEKRIFLFWKPLVEMIYGEEVDRTFGNMYDLEEYLKELVQDRLSDKEDFSIMFL